MTTLIQRLIPRFSLQRYLFKRIKRESQTELTARRIYILPTREGVFFCITIFLLLAGAMNYNNSLLFIFTFLLAGIGIITMYHTHNNLLHAITRANETAAVYAGEDLIIPIQISLKSNQTKARYNLVLEIFDTENRNLKKDKKKNSKKNSSKKNKFTQQQFFDLGENEKHITNFRIETSKRGYLKPPRLTLSSRYPLGLLRAWSNLLLDQQYLVYPKPLAKAELYKIKFSAEDGAGEQGKGHDEFIELREKTPSDAYTHVHWKVFARSGLMLVKQYGGTASENINLKWSDFPQYDTEKRLSLFTRILLEAYQQQQFFSLELPNEFVPLGAGSVNLHHCLKVLALFQTDESE